MAEEGDKNVEISDADKKMDALCDMIRDACTKMDSVGSRMDALEEKSNRMDARMDAMRKDEEEDEKKEDRKDSEDEKEEKREDARKDEDEEKEGEAKEVKADKRKDSEEKEEKREDRKDARKDEDEEAMADAVPALLTKVSSLQDQIAALQARAPAILSAADRERFAVIQEEADAAFQAFGDRAPAPMDGETPTNYKRRLTTKMQAHSSKWRDTRLSGIADEATIDVIAADVYADSIAAARAGVDIPAGQLRKVERSSGGHTIIEWEGAPDSWMNAFAGNSQRATGDWRRPN